MLLSVLISAFIISLVSIFIQVPIFIWLYKNLVNNIHIDYIHSTFWFIFIQWVISILLIVNNNYIDISALLSKVHWEFNNINVWWNVLFGSIVNLVLVSVLTILLNKFVIQICLWDNFFITFVLLLILIVIVPLLLYLYLILD